LHDLPADPESSDDSSSDDEDIVPPNEQCSVCLLRHDENCHSSLNHSLIHYNNLGKCGGNVGKSLFLRRNYGKLSFFEGGIITTSVKVIC
jgi:hypothetical protein